MFLSSQSPSSSSSSSSAFHTTTDVGCSDVECESGSEYECESGSECMPFVDPTSHCKLPVASYLSSAPPLAVAAGFRPTAPPTDVTDVSSIVWPKRLLTKKDGLGDVRHMIVDKPHHYVFVDVETSGPIWGVHSVLAIAVAVMQLTLRAKHWEVRIVDMHTFVYPQDNVIFERGICDPGGFWYRHRAVLDLMRSVAVRQKLKPEQVTCNMMEWWDDMMRRYNYPHIWSDNPGFDSGLISLMIGTHLNRPGLAFVQHPEFSDRFIYARPAHHVESICMDMIHPEVLRTLDYYGAPSLLNLALKHQAFGDLIGIAYDHNPANDVQRVALNFGRLLCRYIERRSDVYPDRPKRDVLCFTYGSERALLCKLPQVIYYSRSIKPKSVGISPSAPAASSSQSSSSADSAGVATTPLKGTHPLPQQKHASKTLHNGMVGGKTTTRKPQMKTPIHTKKHHSK